MDELLNAITNRSGGFCSVEFPQKSTFTPRPQNTYQVEMRDLLGLSRADTDYFVHACLTIMTTQPDLAALFGEQERSYDLRLYRAAQPQVQDGALEHDSGIPGGVLRRAAEWPVQFELTLLRLSPTTALLSLPGEREELVGIVALDDRLRVAWPAWPGVTGLLVPRSPWTPGSTIRIQHVPVRFPFQQLRDKLLASDAAVYLLTTTQLLDAFLNTQSPQRAVALAITALGLSNL
jgi:hypothetical protein